MGDLKETAAQVAALIPRYSWELMDEEQKDALLEKVILPRYMQTTHDGVELGPTWWAEQVGATASAVQSRVQRLRTKARAKTDPPASTPAQAARVRHARAVLRGQPAVVAEQIAEAFVNPEVRAAVEAKIRRTPTLQVALAEEARRSAPRPYNGPPPRTRAEIDADTIAKHRELGITPPPPDPWGPFWKAIALLLDVHANMHDRAWDYMAPEMIASIALTAEREARFLDSLAAAAQERVVQTAS